MQKLTFLERKKMLKSEMKTVKNQNRKEQIMKKEFKEIIEKYPAFSRGLISDMVNEFEEAGEMLEEKFIKTGNGNIYLFEENREYYNLVIISEENSKVFIEYRGCFKPRHRSRNFEKGLELASNDTEWDYFFNIELDEKIKKSKFSFEFYYYFYILKGKLEYIFMKNIVNYLSEEFTALLVLKNAIIEMEQYCSFLEIPVLTEFNEKTECFHMLEKELDGKIQEYKELPPTFMPCAMFCRLSEKMGFVLEDIKKRKEDYLKSNSELKMDLCEPAGFLINYFEVNGLNKEWNLNFKNIGKKEISFIEMFKYIIGYRKEDVLKKFIKLLSE
jgi:hypothetical protein